MKLPTIKTSFILIEFKINETTKDASVRKKRQKKYMCVCTHRPKLNNTAESMDKNRQATMHETETESERKRNVETEQEHWKCDRLKAMLGLIR